MKILIQKELRQTRKILLIWLALDFMLIGFCYFEFLSLKDSMDEMAEMMNLFPQILLLMFGVKADLSTSLGWYTCLYFWTAILAFAYSVYLGLSCVAKEKVRGTAEYLFTKPVAREKIVLAKVMASICNLLIFAVFYGVCAYTMIILPAGGLDQPGAEVMTVIGLFLTQIVFFFLGLVCSSLIKSYRKAVRAGAGLLLASYGISVAIDYLDVHQFDVLSPLRYFDAYDLIVAGFRPGYLLLTAAIAALCIWVSFRQWRRRELSS